MADVKVLVDSSDPDNIKVLYDPTAEKVLVQPEKCDFSFQFEIKIDSSEFTGDDWFGCDVTSSRNSPVGIFPWQDGSTGHFFFEVDGFDFDFGTDSAAFFDIWHTIAITYSYD